MLGTPAVIFYLKQVRDHGPKAWVTGNTARKGGAVSRMWDRIVDAGLAIGPPYKITKAGRDFIKNHYTSRELKLFDKLTLMTSSRSQMDRICGRLGLQRFIKKHGRAKCDLMWADLRAKENAKRAKIQTSSSSRSR